MKTEPDRGIADRLEEGLIALLLAAMTVITFANVIARYLFQSGLLWGLEATVYLFAWMVLLGAGYCVKSSAHLGVDVVINLLPGYLRRRMSLIAVAACIAFSLLLLKGAWDYWFAFVTKRAFLEVNDIPMPDFLQFLSTWLNEGEAYEKLPRFIPYTVLPLSAALLTWRFIQLGWRIYHGQQDRMIAAHEAEPR